MEKDYLNHALRLARSRQGSCAPNPSVGAVLVHADKIIAQGWHNGAGTDHAEVMALSGGVPQGSDLYVTLEPCCHHGRTPPCTDLIVANKISRVFYGFTDPNPVVAGNGAAVLQAAGITAVHLPLEEIDNFYRPYNHWCLTQRPWVTTKLALSLDGKVGITGMPPTKLTSELADEASHLGRLHADAILTSAQTIIADNPKLTARVEGSTVEKPIYVIDSQGRTPESATILTTPRKVVIFTSPDLLDTPWALAMRKHGARLDASCFSPENRNFLPEVLAAIGREGVHSLWVEAGPGLVGSLIEQGLCQQTRLLIAPRLLGEGALDGYGEWTGRLSSASQIEWKSYGRDVGLEVVW